MKTTPRFLTSTPHLELQSVVARAEGQVSCELDGVAVVMSTTRGTYYRIDEIGSRIWSMLEEPLAVTALCERLAARYDVAEATCRHDVLAFLQKMRQLDLIRLVGAGADA